MKSCHLCSNQDFCIVRITIAKIEIEINVLLTSGEKEIETPYQSLIQIIAGCCNRFKPIN